MSPPADASSRLSVALATIFALSTALLLVLDAFGLSLFHGTFDPQRAGNYGDWFQGIVTLVTIGIGLLAIRNDRRLAELASADARSARLDAQEHEAARRLAARRQEASQLFVWIERRDNPITGLPRPPVAIFANMTGAPVFKWTLRLPRDGQTVDSTTSGLLLPPGRSELELDPARISFQVAGTIAAEIVFETLMGETVRRVGTVTEVME